ncbi:MAG: methyltransferase domain-containing protein [Fimbriimonadaceae bacterium]|nr:methyltransferase domain-containing protein [Chthonomonadaceae bacterium]MCO5296042.1 methyltransferase domain-containing protein [Fimbriimonadaceae bacterium]
MSHTEEIQHHYENPRLLESILEGLRASGKDPDHLAPEDLSAVDEFHIRGRESTTETAKLASFPKGSHVLDIGSGIGGPSRHLASQFGLRMTGIDLSPLYCDIATELARRTGLSDQVRYQQADATSLPFADETFDGTWTQHASMNIENKEALYREMARVVKRGGKVVLYDIYGKEGEPHFPVPWARTPDISFLCSSDGIRAHLEKQGLVPIVWNDDSEQALEWFERRIASSAARGPDPVGLHQLFGPIWSEMAKNIVRNLKEKRIGVVQGVWTKP